MKRATFIVVLMALQIPAAAPAQTTPADKGKAIGETFVAAVNAAAPGIEAVGAIIKKLFGGGEKKVTEAEVKKAIEEQSKVLKEAASEKLKDLSTVVAGINAVNDLATKATIANRSLDVAATQLRIGTPEALKKFKGQWSGVVLSNIKMVAQFNGENLGSINGEDVQSTWKQFVADYSQTVQNVSDALDDSKPDMALIQVERLQDKLGKLMTIPSGELKGLASQLSRLAAADLSASTGTITLKAESKATELRATLESATNRYY